MSNRNEQNGRPPPLPGQAAHSLDGDHSHENAVTTEKKEICRNFVWGSCNKGLQCKFRHELDFEEMKKILKFCHDFQNPPGCIRELCTYLHATKEEESLFYTTGKLPRVLAERHENMSAIAAETIPQIALFIKESFGGPPPPPPPPLPVAAMPILSAHGPRPAPPMLPLQQLPPPPPPPTVSSTTIHQQAPIFTASASQPGMVFPMNLPPPPTVPIFDASRPPPPIPHGQTTNNNNSLKRLPQNQFEAPPKKVKKLEKGKAPDAYCEQCIQRQNRIKSLKQEMDKLSSDEEYHTLIHRKKLEEYQNLKEILRSLVGSEVFKLIEESVEETPQQFEVNDVFTQLSQSSFVTETSHTAKNVIVKILQWLMESSRIGTGPSLRIDDSVLQTISTQIRRPANVGLSQSSDVYQKIMELIKKSPGDSQGSRGPPAIQAPPPPIYHPYTPSGPPPAAPPRLYYPPPFPLPPNAPVSAGPCMRAPPPPAPPTAPLPAQTCHPYSSSRYPPPFYQRHQ